MIDGSEEIGRTWKEKGILKTKANRGKNERHIIQDENLTNTWRIGIESRSEAWKFRQILERKEWVHKG